MQVLRNRYRLPYLSLAVLLFVQSFFAVPVHALTSGPDQPEYHQMQTVSADNLVDPFTGNFQYSIPLFEIGGYPMTLNYSSDHKMEEEASWVGFGWSLSPGAISRQVRGVPDDFDGDEITRTTSMAPNITTGIKPGASVEIGGFFGLSAGLNFSHNTFSGFQFSRDLSPNLNIAEALGSVTESIEVNLNESSSNNMGTPINGITPVDNPIKFPRSFVKIERKLGLNFNLGSSINSRTGAQQLGYGISSFGFGNLNFNGGSNISLAGFSYTPVGDIPLNTSSFTFELKQGVKPGAPIAISADIEGFRVEQSVIATPIARPAFGYLNLEGAQRNRRSVSDYNTEQGGVYQQKSPRLPIAYGTPDIFMVSGAGIGGSIRVARNDVGIFHPPYSQNNSISGSGGFELSAGDIVHPGLNISAVSTTNKVGFWNDPLWSSLRFGSNIGAREAAFMQMEGEAISQVGQSWFDAVDGVFPLTTEPIKLGGTIGLSPQFQKLTASDGALEASSLELNELDDRNRRPRAQMVSYLTNEEASVAAVTKPLVSYRPYRLGSSNDANPSALRNGYTTTRLDDEGDNNDNFRQPHHISQVAITNTGGQRFVYGLPVYNLEKKEVTFNISGVVKNPIAPDPDDPNMALPDQISQPVGIYRGEYGLVDYTPQDASIGNIRGRDNYYDEVVTDPYPYAHLLTEVLSPDYVDRTGDGPSFDDLGQYVKIGYSRADANGLGRGSGSIGWRVPLGVNKATFNAGNYSDLEDDKASYTYGRKEAWYAHHMDSKTHRAVFFTSARQDSYSIDENGSVLISGSANSRYRKLDEIRIYTHSELKKNGADAVPLKTIRFEYAGGSEDIGISVPTNNGSLGKLTLSKLFITYADNERGAENPYQFSYKLNPDDGSILPYQYGMLDRWGNQRPKTDGFPGPQLFPYTIQDSIQAADYSGMWNLDSINLPTGGTMNIDYEPDDYAYVQNKRAGRMFRLLGLTEEFDDEIAVEDFNQLYRNSVVDPYEGPNLNLHIEVDDLPLTSPTEIDMDEVKRRYFEDVEQLYFDARVHLRPGESAPEQIKGYLSFNVEEVKAFRDDGPTDRLVIPVQGVNSDGLEQGANRYNPISYAGLEKIRLEIPQMAYQLADETEEFVEFLYTMLSVMREIGQVFRAFHGWKSRDGFAQTIDSDGSFVRLAEPTFSKIGDGSRVKRVHLNDAWLVDVDGITDQSVTYTQVYEYTKIDPATDSLISSGVAANEPQIGREENLLVNQQENSQRILFAPDNTYYMEGPVGSPFYPGAQVGYSQVSMKQEVPAGSNQSKPGTSIYEFYTAKDFPVVSHYTPITPAKINPFPDLSPFSNTSLSTYAMTQGYSVEVNDMHGKMKRTRELGAAGDLISESFYRYSEQSTATSAQRKLNNLLPVAHSENGTIAPDYLGLDQEIWMEMRQTSNVSKGGGLSANLDFGAPLIIWPSLFPSVTYSENYFQTAITTKLSRRYGILEEIEVTNNGSTLSTENQVWDALTGAVVRNSSENEFDQPIYSQSLPAYYMDEHGGMGPAYENEGASFENVRVENGRVQFNSSFESILCSGDELLLERPAGYSPTYERCFVFEQGGLKYIVRSNGSLLNPSGVTPADAGRYAIKIIRSGQRNIIAAGAGQTASLSPSNNQLYWSNNPTNDRLLNSSAVVFSDKWSNQCLDPIAPPGITVVDTPLECDEADQFMLVDLLAIEESGPEPPSFQLNTIIDQLIECDYCEELFFEYANRGFIDGWEDFVDCGPGGVPEFIDNDAMIAVQQCAFINSNNPWLLNGAPYGDPENDNGPNCQGAGATTTGNGATDRPVALGSQNTTDPCFPWEPGDIANPYLDGRRGNWRPAETYVAKQQDRNYTRAGAPLPTGEENDYTQPLIFQDGTFDGYLPFWQNSGERLNDGLSHLLTERVHAYDDLGHQLETSDALGIRSAAQYSYQHDLMTAVSQNASRTDIGVENFEDYDYNKIGLASADRLQRHFFLTNATGIQLYFGLINSTAAHTGQYSMRMKSTAFNSPYVRTVNYTIPDCIPDEACDIGHGCECTNSFAPTAETKDYHFSFWVARDESLECGENAGTPGSEEVLEQRQKTFHLRTRQLNGTQIVEGWKYYYPSGPIIDGWQQVQGTITMRSDADKLRLQLRTPQNATITTYFYVDDFRIQPQESVMTTYVYDPHTMRLSAQLDENNYATFYEYDDEGRLIRLKRETDRGVMTISEQHTNLARTDEDPGE